MKTGIYIGRFSPLHNGHLAAINYIKSKVDKLIIIIGSASQGYSIKNPFNINLRKKMVLDCISGDQTSNIKIIFAEDHFYIENGWVEEIQNKVSNLIFSPSEIILFGHERGKETSYLKWFPQWKYEELPAFEDDLSASKVRMCLFDKDSEEDYSRYVPASTVNIIEKWKVENEEVYKDIEEEFEYVKNYKASWSSAPYPPTFICVDATLYFKGHVLLIKRKSNPGKGKLALPGGFINQDEYIIDACIRELYEETNINIDASFLKKMLKEVKVFDYPFRSMRGRTITHNHFFILDDLPDGLIPVVSGSDDAEKAFWLSVNDVYNNRNNFFDDHYFMLNYFLRRV